MKRSIKAALLSALVCPGAGHYYLKKHAAAMLFFAALSVPVYFIVTDIVSRAQYLVDQIVSGEIPADIILITQKLSVMTAADGEQSIDIKIYAIFAIWLVSIIDSYRLGLAKEAQ